MDKFVDYSMLNYIIIVIVVPDMIFKIIYFPLCNKFQHLVDCFISVSIDCDAFPYLSKSCVYTFIDLYRLVTICHIMSPYITIHNHIWREDIMLYVDKWELAKKALFPTETQMKLITRLFHIFFFCLDKNFKILLDRDIQLTKKLICGWLQYCINKIQS